MRPVLSLDYPRGHAPVGLTPVVGLLSHDLPVRLLQIDATDLRRLLMADALDPGRDGTVST